MVKIKRLTPDWWATVGAFEARVDVEVDDSNALNTGRSPTAWRTSQIDPKRAFPFVLGTEGMRQFLPLQFSTNCLVPLEAKTSIECRQIDAATVSRRQLCQGCLGAAISWFDHAATISSSRPIFGWPLRRVAVKGGRRRSRSDLPLMGTSAVSDSLDRETRVCDRICDDTEGNSPMGAHVAPQTCIRSTAKIAP